MDYLIWLFITFHIAYHEDSMAQPPISTGGGVANPLILSPVLSPELCVVATQLEDRNRLNSKHYLTWYSAKGISLHKGALLNKVDVPELRFLLRALTAHFASKFVLVAKHFWSAVHTHGMVSKDRIKDAQISLKISFIILVSVLSVLSYHSVLVYLVPSFRDSGSGWIIAYNQRSQWFLFIWRV